MNLFRLTILAFVATLAIHSNTFAQGLANPNNRGNENLPDEQCEKTRVPTKTEILNAGMMTTELVKVLESTAAEMKKSAKTFDVAIIARTGTSPGKNIPLKEVYENGRYLSLRDMVERAKNQSRSYNNENEQQHIQSNLEEVFGDKKNPYRHLGFSHVGLLFRDHPYKGKWYVVHLLSPCYSTSSNIYDEGLPRFFVDKPYDYGTAVFIPPAEIQRRIKELIFTDQMAWDFKAPVYNVASALGNMKEENSNQWPLEILAAAMRPRGQVYDRRGALDVLKQHGFMPTKLSLHGKYQMAATLPPFLIPDYVRVRSSEHPYSSSGIVEIVTVLSIEEFMTRNKLIERKLYYRLPDNMRFEEEKKKEKANSNNSIPGRH